MRIDRSSKCSLQRSTLHAVLWLVLVSSGLVGQTDMSSGGGGQNSLTERAELIMQFAAGGLRRSIAGQAGGGQQNLTERELSVIGMPGRDEEVLKVVFDSVVLHLSSWDPRLVQQSPKRNFAVVFSADSSTLLGVYTFPVDSSWAHLTEEEFFGDGNADLWSSFRVSDSIPVTGLIRALDMAIGSAPLRAQQLSAKLGWMKVPGIQEEQLVWWIIGCGVPPLNIGSRQVPFDSLTCISTIVNATTGRPLLITK
ncbi:MAG: hypothetical protein NDJ18_02755 [candidate division Zixibacteria bacterium]|nr:hypothetical protein [candidate division Zixibacteria bacterium]